MTQANLTAGTSAYPVAGQAETAIKNIVFDLGGVLIHFNPRDYIDTIFADRQARPYELIPMCHTQAWREMDRGTLDADGVANALQGQFNSADVAHFIRHMPALHVLRPGAFALAKRLKARGYRLYILSNMAKPGHEVVKALPGFLELFDGAVFSHEVRLVKPEPAIFHHLLTTFGLKAAECFFLDDSAHNIEAAKKCGLQGLLYDDDKAVESALAAFGLL